MPRDLFDFSFLFLTPLDLFFLGVGGESEDEEDGGVGGGGGGGGDSGLLGV